MYGTGYGSKWKKNTLKKHQLSTEKFMNAFMGVAVIIEMSLIAIVKISKNICYNKYQIDLYCAQSSHLKPK